MSTLKYWLWLSSLKGLGPVSAARLLERFGSPRDVYFAAAPEYKAVQGLRESERLILSDKSLSAAEKILADCDELGIDIITLQDSAYPERLKNIYDPPTVLYVRGKLPVLDEEPAVAMVGSRRATAYGIVTAEKLAFQVASHGGVVISGMAAGIDSAAHRGALKAGGVTIAVLAGGPDDIYPRENRWLYEDILASGAIVSEMPPGRGATKVSFPRRNRIISGLSVAVVVVEAAQRSGALITASLANEQGREVFAVPGNVDAEMSAGCNALIRDGAVPAASGWDILRDYQPMFLQKITARPQKTPEIRPETKPEPVPPAVARPSIDLESRSQDEREIFTLLMQGEAMQTDDIIEKTQIPASRALTALTLLEVSGAVEQHGAGYFKIGETQRA